MKGVILHIKLMPKENKKDKLTKEDVTGIWEAVKNTAHLIDMEAEMFAEIVKEVEKEKLNGSGL